MSPGGYSLVPAPPKTGKQLPHIPPPFVERFLSAGSGVLEQVRTVAERGSSCNQSKVSYDGGACVIVSVMPR